MERIRGMIDGLRSYWENLTDRERRMLSVLGGVGALIVVVLPVFFLSRSIAQLEEKNEEIGASLRLISRSRGEIAAMRAEQTAREVRYAQGAPGEDWLPNVVQKQGLSFSRVQHQPDRVVGDYTIHTTRASFRETGLRAAILLLAELKNDRHMVAIERIHVDHNRAGDQYNLEVGVLTFKKDGASAPDAGVPAGGRP